jgi:hypothetical protein
LVVNELEAARVCRIFQLYLEERSAPALLKRLRDEGIRTQVRTSASGNPSGGRWFTRGHVCKLLSNPIYVGQISHKGLTYPGQHHAIVDMNAWNAVQEKLAQNTREEHMRRRRALPGAPLLANLLFTQTGNRMIPVSSKRAGRRYRYYAEVFTDGASEKVANSAVPPDDHNIRNALGVDLGAPRGTNKPKLLRLPAMELEAVVLAALAEFLTDHQALLEHLGEVRTERVSRTVANAENLAATPPEGRSSFIRGIVQRVTVSHRRAKIEVSQSALRHSVGLDQLTTETPVSEASVALEAGLTYRKRGPQFKLAIEGQTAARPIPDAALVVDVARAFDWFERLSNGEAKSIADIAAIDGFEKEYVNRVLPLAFLPPQFVAAALAGRQPAEISADRLIGRGRVPMRWPMGPVGRP